MKDCIVIKDERSLGDIANDLDSAQAAEEYAYTVKQQAEAEWNSATTRRANLRVEFTKAVLAKQHLDFTDPDLRRKIEDHRSFALPPTRD